MALIAAHLNAGVILVVTVVALGIVSLFPHLLRSRSPPVAYLLGANSALNKFNQLK